MAFWILDEEKRKAIITHEIKILPDYFEQVKAGNKNFEIRKNDRNFQAGDKVILKEWAGGYTGRKIMCSITFITNYKQRAGFVVLGIKPLLAGGDEVY
ncbi:DUF3850 domain-containing protein [Listeria ilorinensis]|uniref:DUF3850 domain-containing protein n=1 Tax=Listeria ilorinensis TaxID=2867439 RepID=UPI001EF4065B|nr:DUF3850 domain-containing protein [Listeria ilorinensis]